MSKHNTVSCLSGNKSVTFTDITPPREGGRGSFGRWLKYERRKQGLSLAELRRRTGICASMIHHFERHEMIPTTAEADRLEASLGLSPGELVKRLENE